VRHDRPNRAGKMGSVTDVDICPDVVSFGKEMQRFLDTFDGDHVSILEHARDISHNLERLKMVAAYVRRQAMLDAHLDLGNGAEVGRLAGVGRVRSHELLHRATDERMRNASIEKIAEYAISDLYT